MSTSSDGDFDLEKLFLPNWAKESPQDTRNRYADYSGEPQRRGDRGGRGERRRDRPDRSQRRGDRGRPPGQGSGAPGSPTGRSGPGGPGAPRDGRDNSNRRGAGGGGGGGRTGQGTRRRQDRDNRPPAPLPALPELQVAFLPNDQAVDLLAKQICVTGRAYPLFGIAQLILQKPDRHGVTVSTKKKPDGEASQGLFLCALDESLWLSEQDAVQHVLDKHFATFYQAERTKKDPPKGVYTFVAQCGMSGVILGPPNYHDYQNQLRKLHSERFPRIAFEGFKSRVKIVRDEEVVKKWVEDQSWQTEYVCLNLPEPLKLPNLDEVRKHFRQVHLANIIKPVETHRLTGAQSRNVRDRDLMRLVRVRWEDQKRFPLQIATVLSQQFASRGLQFFKVNRTVTHVSVARPHYLDLETIPVSDRVRKIIDFINENPKCKHKQLLEALAGDPPDVSTTATTAPATTTSTPVETPTPTPTPAPEAEPATAPDAQSAAAPAPAPEAEPAPAVAPATERMPEPSPAMTAVMTDLHWLIHQGHVIEFADGHLETAKKPAPKPVKKTTPATAPKAAETGGDGKSDDAKADLATATSAPDTNADADAATAAGKGSTSAAGEADTVGPGAQQPAPAPAPAPASAPTSAEQGEVQTAAPDQPQPITGTDSAATDPAPAPAPAIAPAAASDPHQATAQPVASAPSAAENEPPRTVSNPPPAV